MLIISTKRLLLVPPPFQMADVKQQVEWLNDKELMKYSEQRHHSHDIDSQIHYISSFDPPSQFRIISTGNHMIGTITAHVDKYNEVADMGILIGDKSKWGRGYGTEAWKDLMQYLFCMHGIRKIEAGCMECNHGMLKIFEKSGMRQEGSRFGHFVANGLSWDLEQWAKFNDGVH